MSKALYILIAMLAAACSFGAAVMDGKDDYFVIEYPAPAGPGGFTVAFKLKLSEEVFAAEHRKRAFHIFELQSSAKTVIKVYFVNQHQGTNAGYLAFSLSGAEPGTARYNYLVPVEQIDWMEIVLSFGRGVFNVWVDRAEQSTLHRWQSIPEIPPAENYRLYFGMTPWRGGKLHTPCSLGEIVLLEKIILPAELNKLWSDTNTPGLTGYFPLKDNWRNTVKNKAPQLTLPEAKSSQPRLTSE